MRELVNQANAPDRPVREALRESEDLYRLLFQNTNDGILLAAPDGRIFSANPVACNLLGMTEEEVCKLGGEEIVDRADERAASLLKQLLQTGQVRGEMRFRRKDGTCFEAEVSSSLFALSDGQTRATIILRDITRRKRIEEAVRRAEERFHAVANYTLGWETWVSPEGRLLWVNPAVEQVTGYTVNDCFSMPDYPLPIVDERDRDMVAGHFRAAVIGSQGSNLEFRIRRKDGGSRWGSVSWQPMYDSSGVFIGHRSSIQDMTDRRMMEEQLEESEKRDRGLFEVEPDAILLADGDTGRFIDANPAASRLYGYSHHELLAMHLRDLSADAQETVRALVTRERAVSLHQQRKKDGTIVPVEIVARLFQSNGRPVVIASVRDITKRKRDEDVLRKSENFARSVLDGLSAHIAVLNESGTILAVNEAWRAFAAANGLTAGQAGVGVNYLEVCESARGESADNAAKVAAAIRSVLRREQPSCECEYPCHSPDEKRWFVVRVTPFPGSAPSYTVVAHENVTQLKQVEQALEISLEQQRELGMRLEQLREEERKMISREVHDELGQLLTTIRLDLMKLRKSGNTDAGALDASVLSLVALTDSAVKTVQDVSARLRPGLLDDLGLVPALEWQTEEFQKRTGVRCVVTIPGRKLSMGAALSTVLFRILQEALTNVARHSGAKKVEVYLSETDGRIILSVKDDGIGISQEEIRSQSSLGLLGIRERLRPFNGTFEIRAVSATGTELLVCIPGENNDRGQSA